MIVIKRDGREMPFDRVRIERAIYAANKEVAQDDRLSDEMVGLICGRVEQKCIMANRPITVEEIQDMIEDEMIDSGHARLMRHFQKYRHQHAMLRKQNTTDAKVLSLLRRDNSEARDENSNKNPVRNNVMRDYLAGEVSRDICRRYLFPKHIVNAHDEGIIHIHDMDYISGPLYNCCLVNLDDMLQNGTVISGTLIEKPHSFSTACNIASQISWAVASNQYGGQTMTLSHLAPFVDESRKRIRQDVVGEFEAAECQVDENTIDSIVEQRVRREITRGVQTLQYQLQTLISTNGQSPFITIFMYLDEVPEGQLRDDLAMVIEEVLKQRYQGVKNEVGAWVSPAFPKLIYCLDEDNIHEDSKYWYLTELAAKCSAKRLVPDYISAKMMRDQKGDVYPCMGCRSFLTPASDTLTSDGNHKYYGRFNQGVVTINLVDVACSAEGDEEQFWKLMPCGRMSALTLTLSLPVKMVISVSQRLRSVIRSRRSLEDTFLLPRFTKQSFRK